MKGNKINDLIAEIHDELNHSNKVSFFSVPLCLSGK